jgi:hypothetical protein
MRITSAILSAPARNDFPTLCGVGDSRLSASLVALLSVWIPPSLLAALAALAPEHGAAALNDLERARLTASVVAVVKAHGMPVLRRRDFAGRGSAPHVGVIYLNCVTMPAQCWLDEYERVIERNERTSKVTGEEVEVGYFIMLAEMAPLARALVASDKSGSARCALPLTGFYIGQELRAVNSGSRFGRVGEHGSLSGNVNIREVYCVRASGSSHRGEASIYVEPLCDCPRGERVTVVRCFLALLPPRARSVDLAEDAIMCFFTVLHLPLFNNTPGTARRWLQPSYRGERPLLEETLELHLVKHGVVKLAARTATEDVTYFVARALRAVELRLLHGQRVRIDDGEAREPLLPELRVSPSAAAPAGRAFSQLQCIDAAFGGSLQRVVELHLWSGGCTCEGGYSSGPICAYQILARMYVASRPRLRVSLPDRDLELLHLGLATESSSSAAPRSDCGPLAQPRARRAEGGETPEAAAAAPAPAPAAAAADLSVDLLALGTVLPHLPPEEVTALHRALRTAMASTGVWERFQERRASGGGANFSGAHMPLARLQSRKEVESAGKMRRVLLDASRPLARLETALRAESALPAALVDDAAWGAVVVHRGGGAAASAASALWARAYPLAAPALALAPSLEAAAAAAPVEDALAAMVVESSATSAFDAPHASGLAVGGVGSGERAAAGDASGPPVTAAVGAKRSRPRQPLPMRF